MLALIEVSFMSRDENNRDEHECVSMQLYTCLVHEVLIALNMKGRGQQ